MIDYEGGDLTAEVLPVPVGGQPRAACVIAGCRR